MKNNKFEQTESMDIFENLKSTEIDNEKIKEAEKKSSFLGKLSNDFILLLEMLKATLSGKFEMSKKDLALLIGGVLYVALPIDATPDFIPLIGYLDDIWIIGIVISTLSENVERYRNKKK